MTIASEAPSRPSFQGAISPFAGTSGLAWLPFVYLLCVLVPIGFQAGPLAMTTLRLLLIIVTIPLTIKLLAGRFGKPLATDYLLFGHLIWATVALAVNNPDRVIQQSGSVGVEFIGGYLVGRATIRSREDFAALCRTLVWMVLITTPFAILESQTGQPIIVNFIRSLPKLTSVYPVTIEGRLGLERVQATFAHPIHYGLFCSVAFSLTFVALKGIIGDARRWVSSVLILCSGLLALSSGALLAMVLQIGLIAWQLMFSEVRQRWRILVALFAVAYVVVDVLSNRTPLEVFISYATFNAHNAYWRTIIFDWGLDNVTGNPAREIPPSPWFGIGLNDWIRPSFMHSGSMDNFWLVMTVRYGLPGFFLLAAGYILGIAKVMRRVLEGDRMLQNFRMAWVFTFLGLTFTLSTVHIWTNIYSFVFFMFGAGMWFLDAEPDTGEGTPEDAEPAEGRRGSRFTRFEDADASPVRERPAAPEPSREDSRGAPVFARDPAPDEGHSQRRQPEPAPKRRLPKFTRGTG